MDILSSNANSQILVSGRLMSSVIDYSSIKLLWKLKAQILRIHDMKRENDFDLIVEEPNDGFQTTFPVSHCSLACFIRWPKIPPRSDSQAFSVYGVSEDTVKIRI